MRPPARRVSGRLNPARRALLQRVRAELAAEGGLDEQIDLIDVKAKQRAYNERPDVKAKKRAYNERPDVKAKQRAYNERPDVKAKQRAYQHEYGQKRRRAMAELLRRHKAELDVIRRDGETA